MGYIMTYMFMLAIAVVAVGGYSLYKKCEAYYKELEQ
jgi:hypothetical protein